MSRLRASRRLGLALLPVMVTLGALTATASASIPVYTTVNNDTDVDVIVKEGSDGESCWNSDDFSDSTVVSANSSYTYYSSVRDSNGSCVNSLSDENAHIYLELL